MSKKIEASVIIPVYNRSDELRLTLQSIAKQTLPKDTFEVIIADDGSSEALQGVLGEFPDLQLKYVFQQDEGFRAAAARNLGTSLSSGKILVYSDNGILLSSDALERHIEYHTKGEDGLVLLGCMMATGWGTDYKRVLEILTEYDIDAAITTMKGEGICDGRNYLFTKYGHEVSDWYIPWLSLWGGHFSVNSLFVKKHGIRWSDSFVTWGGEDNEYGIQLCNAGARLQFCEDIEVAHYPTPGSKAITAIDEDSKKGFAETMQHILSLHPDNRGVKAWCKLGSLANDPLERAKLCEEG